MQSKIYQAENQQLILGDVEKDMKHSQEIAEPLPEVASCEMQVKPATPGHFSEFGRDGLAEYGHEPTGQILHLRHG
jgi:hypothetical protein